MVRPLDAAWSVLKALPEDSLYTEEVSRTGSGAYGDPALTPAVVQNRLQTMHPAIRGMMQRRLQYGSTPRQKHMGRIEGYGKGNIRYPAPREGIPVIEDVPTIQMPYYPEEGFPHSMGPLGDVGIRSGTGASEHLPMDETYLASHEYHGGHRQQRDETRSGRYPGGKADRDAQRALRSKSRAPLDVFRDVPDMAIAEQYPHDERYKFSNQINSNESSMAQSLNFDETDPWWAKNFPGAYPSSITRDGEKRAFGSTASRGYGHTNNVSSDDAPFDPEQFGRSIFDYDMRDE